MVVSIIMVALAQAGDKNWDLATFALNRISEKSLTVQQKQETINLCENLKFDHPDPNVKVDGNQLSSVALFSVGTTRASEISV